MPKRDAEAAGDEVGALGGTAPLTDAQLDLLLPQDGFEVLAPPSAGGARKFELWRNSSLSLNSMGEPMSAWACELKTGKWFVCRTVEAKGRVDELLAAKPEGYTERHLVDEECLDESNWDQELDYHTSLAGNTHRVAVDELKPFV